jgi:hypothetical protein
MVQIRARQSLGFVNKRSPLKPSVTADLSNHAIHAWKAGLQREEGLQASLAISDLGTHIAC